MELCPTTPSDFESHAMPVEPTADSILAFAAARAEEAWAAGQQPYLLARLSPDLAKEGINYKGVLGEQRLKDFLRSAPNLVRVVTHPTQKAKIGLVPPGQAYEFPNAPEQAQPKPPISTASSEKSNGSKRRWIVSSFLQLVSELDDAEAAQVQIPTHILTKLMRDQ